MTVLAVGLVPVPWPDTGDASVAPVDLGLPAILSAVQGGLAADGWVVAVHPAWSQLDPGPDLAVARRALDTPRVVPFPVALPPLAAATLAGLALRLAAEDPGPGLLVAALRHAEQELAVHGWARSVSGLSAPTPSLAQHARSMVPGARFHVEVQPEPHVATVGKAPERALSRPERARVVVAGPADEWRWAEPFVVEKLGEPAERREATAQASSWWGTAKVVEAVALPADPRAALRAVADAEPGVACPWCGEPVWSTPCPLCGFDRHSAGAA